MTARRLVKSEGGAARFRVQNAKVALGEVKGPIRLGPDPRIFEKL